jgi:protein-tyrosine sulfotransferase
MLGLTALCTTTVIMLFLYNRNPDFFSTVKPLQQTGQDLWQAQDKFIELSDEDAKAFGGNKLYKYSRDMPVVFIGGMPRSGTTLLRVMLDSHPDIRCGGETRVIPRLLNLRNSWLKAPFESQRLLEAGITADVLDHAVGEFMLEIMARHGKPAKRLCNKDPFTLKSAVYINTLFPKGQFLFLIRDGRAVAHSIVSRKVTISGFDITNYRQCLKKWNSATSSMYEQCKQLGPKICLPVYYEQLVLHPEQTLRGILKFLNLPWNDAVLHHEKFVNQPDGIELSKLERSTDQVVKPVNTETLTKWVGAMPADVVRDMADIAPMLQVLGYDPNANPPNYGDPDPFVLGKMKIIEQNKDEWKKKEEKLIHQRDELRKALMAQGQKLSSSTKKSQKEQL